jgi:hypothetical protein
MSHDPNRAEKDRPRSRQKKTILDPRCGDIENDLSATASRTLLSIFGSLLAEISLTKLVFAWTVLILLPAVLLGFAPLALTAWIVKTSTRIAEATAIGILLAIVAAASILWLGWRPLYHIAQRNFWSLNALAVQPGYALWREGMRHLVERSFGGRTDAELARMRAISSVAAGILLFIVATLIALAVWPATRWVASSVDLVSPHLLVFGTLANAVVAMSAYLAIAALIWAFADAAGDQPLHLREFETASPSARIWRIAHLSDVHVVGERYGFRMESGRAGPRGNERLIAAMNRLAALHRRKPVDLVLISGDMTDAGITAEWAEFLDTMADFPDLADRMLILPGNHDVNIVDRANPARLDLPFTPIKVLRKMRALSAIADIQGERVRTASLDQRAPGPRLADALEPRRLEMEEFANVGGVRRAARLAKLWNECFPLILPPTEDDGLGVALLDSNANTNFSFTNALGMITPEQARRLTCSLEAYPRARWILALHHHLVEYPMPVKAFSERIGTALVNGAWFLRLMKPYAQRIVIMHGHRHIDWIGTFGRLRLISAPSPVMERANQSTHFYVHSLAAGPNGSINLLTPHRIEISSTI